MCRFILDVIVLVEVPGDGIGDLVGRELYGFGCAVFQVLGRHHISFCRRREGPSLRCRRRSSGRTANWLQIERGDSCFSNSVSLGGPRIDAHLSHLGRMMEGMVRKKGERSRESLPQTHV